MYKAIVADDEDIIRRGIVGFLEEDPEITVVADAADGISTLNQAIRYKPDLIFVDINMPKMDGLALIEKLNELDGEFLVIVITGYNDFEYAQKALRLGVFDYFLKPIMEDPFYETLGKAKITLEENRKHSDLAKQLRSSADYIVERCLNLNSLGILSDEDCLKELTFLREDLLPGWEFLFLTPGRDRINQNVEEDQEFPDSEGISHTICQSLRSAMCLEGRISFISKDDNVVTLGPPLDESCLRKALRTLFQSVETYRCPLTVPEDLPRLYRESLEHMATLISYSPAVQTSIRYIKENYSDPSLSLALLSEVCHISQGYLGRLYKQELHRTPIEYLNRFRINRAAVLLGDPSLKIYEVAEQVGFTSQHYFCHAFKKIMGLSPKNYRQEFISS
jgi:two-component system response regulator YesN